MLGFFKKLRTGNPPATQASPIAKKSERDPLRYAQERMIATSPDVGQRLTLARSERTHREILYYLAENDPDPVVRHAVARNAATPVQAGPILARDDDGDVRYALAARLVALLPDLPRDRQSELYAYAVEALGVLALDEVIKVRLALTTALKDYADAPPKVVGALARDTERVVSEPVLRFCAAIDDADLLDILKGHPASWVVQAIAARKTVSAPVSKAVIDTKDEAAGAILIDNTGAKIGVGLLREIVARARQFPTWHRPLAQHRSLSPGMARELAKFVEPSIRNILATNSALPEDVQAEIAATVTRRVEFAAGDAVNARARVLAAWRDGNLNEDLLHDALSMRDTAFVAEALAYLAGCRRATVDHILALQTAKGIVTLVWKAGLSMRFALQVQTDIAHLPRADIIYPRGGTDYPLSVQELKWQVDFFGL